jgi:hypothetical protein
MEPSEPDSKNPSRKRSFGVRFDVTSLAAVLLVTLVLMISAVPVTSVLVPASVGHTSLVGSRAVTPGAPAAKEPDSLAAPKAGSLQPTMQNISIPNGTYGGIQYDPATGNVVVGGNGIWNINPAGNVLNGWKELPGPGHTDKSIGGTANFLTYDPTDGVTYISGSLFSELPETWDQPTIWAVQKNGNVTARSVTDITAPDIASTYGITYDAADQQVYYDYTTIGDLSGGCGAVGWANNSSIPVGATTSGVCFALSYLYASPSNSSDTIYLSPPGDANVSFLAGSYDAIDGTGPLQSNVTGGIGAFNVASNLLYLPVRNTTTGSGTLDVISLGYPYGWSIIHKIPVGSYPLQALYDPAHNHIFVSNSGSSNVTEISSTSYAQLGTYDVGSDPKGLTIDPGHNEVYVANQGSSDVSVICTGSVYDMTFTETGVASGTSWSVALNGTSRSAVAPSSIVYPSCGDGTYKWSVPRLWGYNDTPTSGTMVVFGSGATQNIAFTAVLQAGGYSQYVSDFLSGYSFTDTIGMMTVFGSAAPTRVYAQTGSTQVNLTGGNATLPYTATINTGSLPAGNSIPIYAVYPTQTVRVNLPIAVVTTPSWLLTFLSLSTSVKLNDATSGEWNNSYSIVASADFSLSQSLGLGNVDLGVTTGQLSLVPNVAFNFNFFSNGTVSFTGSASGQAPSFTLVGENVTVTLTFAVTGKVVVNTTSDTLVWSSSTLDITVGAGASVAIPIAGFVIPGTSIGVGLSATVSLNGQVGLEFGVTPASTSGQDTFPPYPFVLVLDTIAVVLSIGVELTAGINGAASIGGGGTMTVTVNLKASPPSVQSTSVSGSINAQACFLWACYQWNYNLGSLNLGPEMGPYGGRLVAQGANITTPSRYYNTTSYESLDFTQGNYSSEVMQNFYPLTGWSAAAGVGGLTYLIASEDNVSKPVHSGLQLQGLIFNESGRTLSSWAMPSTAGYAVANPVVGTLRDGYELALWDGALVSKLNTSDPFTTAGLDLRYSTYNISSHTWGTPSNWTKWGYPTSYAISTNATGAAVLVLNSNGIFGNTASLIDYVESSRKVISNTTVTGVESIRSFSSVSGLAVLALANGGYEVFNVSKSAAVAIPPLSGYHVDDLEAVAGVPSEVVILEASNASDAEVFFNASAGQQVSDIPTTTGVTSLSAENESGTLTVLVHRGSSLIVQTVVGGISTNYTSFNRPNVTAIDEVVSNGTWQFFSVKTTGSASQPIRSLYLNEALVAPPPGPVISLKSGEGPLVPFSWTLAGSSHLFVTGFTLWASNSTTPSTFEPIELFTNTSKSGTVNFPAPGVYYLAMSATNQFGTGPLGASAGLGTVVLGAQGVPSGGTWSVTYSGVKESSNTSQILFQDAFGSYSFSVSAPSGTTAYPASGKITAGSSPYYQTIRFATTSLKVQSVFFNETGLPTATQWSVTLNGTTQSSNTTSVRVYEPAGTYAYSVPSLSTYAPSPVSGNVTVGSTHATVTITFKKNAIKVNVAIEFAPMLPSLLIGALRRETSHPR